MDMDKTHIALIPAYEPVPTLTDLIIRLCSAHFRVVVVDDGSGEDYRRLFAEARRYAEVLTHAQNCGKGRALKTGLAYIERHCSESATIVTLDADGQHGVEDAVRVIEAAEMAPETLLLGCRSFKGKNVPTRSRFGNRITRLVYKLATGVSVSDAQTGLRAFTAGIVPLLLRIEGDYYGAQQSGYMIRNGVLYRASQSDDRHEDLVIYKDGSFDIVTAQQLLDSGAEQVLSFGPGLVKNGETVVSEGEEVDKAKTSNPRTAIGQIGSLYYVFAVSDGRTSESKGLSLSELAEFMQDLGCKTAYNLDGGGSNKMVFNGTVMNQPTTNGNEISERKVSDIVSIGYRDS